MQLHRRDVPLERRQNLRIAFDAEHRDVAGTPDNGRRVASVSSNIDGMKIRVFSTHDLGDPAKCLVVKLELASILRNATTWRKTNLMPADLDRLRK